MNLTPINPKLLTKVLQTFRGYLEPKSVGARAFSRIYSTSKDVGAEVDTSAHRRAAAGLANKLGIPVINGPPEDGFSWDGRAVRVQSEASVLIHEIAHWLITPRSRRHLPDFGLGAGPETGRAAEANAACCVDDLTKEREEQRASMLGILIEAENGLPAIHSFVEQNWLEGWERPVAGEQFQQVVHDLHTAGYIAKTGRPCVFYEGRVTTAVISIKNSGQANADTSTIAEAGPSVGK